VKNDILYGLPFDEYQRIPAVNLSLLKHLEESPGELEHARRNPKPPSEAMIHGSAIGCLVLEPHLFAKQYTRPPQQFAELPSSFVRAPAGFKGTLTAEKKWLAELRAGGCTVVKDADWTVNGLKMNTTAGKRWKALTEEAGTHVLNMSDMQRVRSAARSVLDYPLARALIDAGRIEVTLVWYDEVHELWCKGRPDIYIEAATQEIVDLFESRTPAGKSWMVPELGEPMIPDLKSTAKSVHPERIGAVAYDGGWHQQLAYYASGCAVITDRTHSWAGNIAVEQDGLFRCEVFRMPDEQLEQGGDEVGTMLQAYAHWSEKKQWPTSTGELQELEFPAWARR